jgi:Zn-dependent protease
MHPQGKWVSLMIQLLLHSPINFVLVFVMTIGSICVHELCHGLAALAQGDDTPVRRGHMTLNPVVHLGWQSIVFLLIAGMAWGAMPVNRLKFRSAKWGEVLVAAAGPLANLALALLAVLLIKGGWVSSTFGRPVMMMMARINLKLFVFNMLPIPPLDGFSVFSEVFPGLRELKDTSFGLMALMILFLSPFGTGVDLLVRWLIAKMI